MAIGLATPGNRKTVLIVNCLACVSYDLLTVFLCSAKRHGEPEHVGVAPMPAA